ncbi:MAG: GxxExxY protein [Pirellulaceae bacterium]
MALIYEDKTEVLRRCFFDVQNEVGLGRREEVYHSACKVWLTDHGVPFASKHPHPLTFRGQVALVLLPDLVVWDSITVELKAVPRGTRSTEFVQLFDYLKCRNDRLGLLVNMGLDRVQVERFVFEKSETTLEEDWTYWSARIPSPVRNVGRSVRDALREIYQEHGTGYGEGVLEKLILFALLSYRLKVVVKPICRSYYRGVELDESCLGCMVVENCIVLTFTALFDGNEFNIHRSKSYLKALGLEWAIATNFGKRKAQLTGVRSRVQTSECHG